MVRAAAMRLVSGIWSSAVLFMAACSTLSVHTDRDPNADFSKYKTYAWAPKMETRTTPLLEERIQAAVDSELAEKGLRKAAEGEATDLIVRDHVVQRQVNEAFGRPTFGLGYDAPLTSFGATAYPLGISQHTEGSWVIDLVDSSSSKLVWRGIATDKGGSPEESPRQVIDAMNETFEGYPGTGTG